MDTLIHRRVKLAQSGKNEKVICRIESGWIVFGDVQFLYGYSLLLPDPVVPSLNDLSPKRRIGFLRDMAVLGEALYKVMNAERINYEILGNSEKALHAHVFPRYENEPEKYKNGPVWFYDWKSEDVRKFCIKEDREIMDKIKHEIYKIKDEF